MSEFLNEPTPAAWFPEEMEAARPRENKTPSEWTPENVVLGSHSAIKGPLPLDMVPFFIGPMDACADPDVNKVVVCKPAQIGGTTSLLVAIVGYYSDQEPSSIGIVLADQDTTEYVIQEKITVMFQESPSLQRLYDSKRFTKHEIKLPNGGYIRGVWASSVAALGTRPFRIMICDEVDKPGYTMASKEASSLSLADERTNTYPEGFYKQIRFSTPTLETGNITVELERCDRIYDSHVPCPHCGQYQPLRWSADHAYGFEKGMYRDRDGQERRLGGVVWKGGSKATKEQALDTARYRCGTCGGLWTTQQKNDAVRMGVDVTRQEESSHDKTFGYHVNRIYSLFDGGRLEVLVEKWLDIARMSDGEVKKKALQGFINSTLAEPFKPYTTLRKTDAILALADERPRGVVPGGGTISALTAGIDTQDDGWWFEVRAWGYGIEMTSWQIREGFVDSEAALLKVIFDDVYKDAGGGQYVIQKAIIDAMGHRTSEVYDICRNHRGLLIPYKGVQTQNAPYTWSNLEYYPNSKRPIPGGLKLLIANSNYYKNQLSTKLNVGRGDPGAWLYHADTTEAWADMMVVEYINDAGFWECPDHKPNHGWDCSVLNLIAADLMGVRYMRPGARKKKAAGAKRPAAKVNPFTGTVGGYM